MTSTALQLSPLQHYHQRAGARCMPFAGWELPLQFSGIVAEHHAVRQSAGLFDISHMGQIVVRGSGAAAALNPLLSNDLHALDEGQSHYSFLLNERGGILDDLIATRWGEEQVFIVCNAANTALAEEWLQAHLPAGISIERRKTRQWGGFALQGPRTTQVLADRMGINLTQIPRFSGISFREGWLSRTGYTGEEGIEYFGPAASLAELYTALLDHPEVAPCGLGARDTLRLEMAYPLHGQDITAETTPVEAGLSPFIAWDKADFLGKEILLAQRENGPPRRLCALRLEGSGPPPRNGQIVFQGRQPIATLTSGAFSPSLREGIALAYLPREHAARDSLHEIAIRNQLYPVRVCAKPFYRPRKERPTSVK